MLGHMAHNATLANDVMRSPYDFRLCLPLRDLGNDEIAADV
jgi:hypothetical protein